MWQNDKIICWYQTFGFL